MTNLQSAPWRKSTQSNTNEGACVEVAALWRKSSHSSSGNDTCVEVADLAGVVAIRDSKDPDGPILMLDGGAARQLADRIRGGELDL